MLAAIYLKIGSYGLIRVGPICFNPAMLSYVLGVSLIGGLFISISILCHPDLKFSVAVSSVSHISLGTFLIIRQTNIGLSASMVLNIGHGYISRLLFLLVGEISKVRNRRSFLLNAKITKSSRLFVGVLVIGLLANRGVPPFLRFYSELSLVTYLEGFRNFMLCF